MKGYLRRLFFWIIKGIPTNNCTVITSQLSRGEELAGKRILITGGGTGIGLAIAKRYISEGAKVVIAGRDEERLNQAKNQIGHNCDFYTYDQRDITSIKELVEKVGKIDGVVCNSGVSLHENDYSKVTEKSWDKQFDTNLKGTFFLLQEILVHRDKNELTILIISSERGMQCDDIPYGLTKASLNSLTKGLSKRLYKLGVRVNAIAPGITATRMTEIEKDENLYDSRLASNRYFIPEEVAEVALFLMSNRSKCISGEVIATDAGNYNSSYF